MGKAENLKTYVVKKPPATAAAAPVAMTSAGAPRVRARTTEYQHKYPGWEGVPQSKPTLNTREVGCSIFGTKWNTEGKCQVKLSLVKLFCVEISHVKF